MSFALQHFKCGNAVKYTTEQFLPGTATFVSQKHKRTPELKIVCSMSVVCVTFRSVRIYGSVGCFFLDWKRELNMSPFDTRTFNSLEERESASH